MLGGPGDEHPARSQHDSNLTDLMDCYTGARLARRPHVGRMRDGRSPLGGMVDVPSTRGLLDGRLKGSIERFTRWQVQMDGRSLQVARLTLGSLANARFFARELPHSRLTASADGRVLGCTGCSIGAQRA